MSKMTLTQTQGNPNVILKADVACQPGNVFTHSQETNIVTPAVNAAYNNGATSVKVLDVNNVQIGSDPRPRP